MIGRVSPSEGREGLTRGGGRGGGRGGSSVMEGLPVGWGWSAIVKGGGGALWGPGAPTHGGGAAALVAVGE